MKKYMEPTESQIEEIATTVSSGGPSSATPFTLQDRIIAASIGGTITAIVVCPFDVVKARLQAQVDSTELRKLNVESTTRFTGTRDAFTKIVRYEGPLNLWRGLTPSVVMAVPSNVLYFTTYEALRDFINAHSHLGLMTLPLSGFGARVVTATVTSPLELIRTNLQATPASERAGQGLIQITSDVLRRGGFKSLWAGLAPTVVRDAPFSAIYWTGYELFKGQLVNQGYEKGFIVDFLSGAGAGVLAATVTNPIDVIKTRRQMHLNPSGPDNYPYKMGDIFREIIKEEGVSGLTKGMLPRLVKVAPACAIMISSYEFCKKHLANLHRQ